MSVTMLDELVSRERSMAFKSLPRLRYCHGTSLWPSMSGTERRSFLILEISLESAATKGTAFTKINARKQATQENNFELILLLCGRSGGYVAASVLARCRVEVCRPAEFNFRYFTRLDFPTLAVR